MIPKNLYVAIVYNTPSKDAKSITLIYFHGTFSETKLNVNIHPERRFQNQFRVRGNLRKWYMMKACVEFHFGNGSHDEIKIACARTCRQ